MSSQIEKVETDVELKASAKQFYDMFCKRPHHISNACSIRCKPAIYTKVIMERRVPSSIRTMFTLKRLMKCNADGEVKVSKEVIEGIDEENNAINYRVIEGDLLKEYKSFVLKLRVTPKSDGAEGSVVNWKMEYEKLHDVIAHPETLLDLAIKVSNDIDAHLIQGN